MKLIIQIPCHNEAQVIAHTIKTLPTSIDGFEKVEYLVVDDGSSDSTSQVAELAGATVIRHEENKGYGSAIQSIIVEAKKKNADILVILDADSQHNPREIPSLVQAINKGSDVVIGSREMQKNTIPSYRRLGQRILSNLTYIVSRRRLSDTESGFRAYSRKAIDTLELKEKGMAISSEIVSDASRKGLKVTEVPISVSYTRDGSTMNPVKHGFGVLRRIMIMISERRPLFFFGLCGGILIVGGILAGVLVVRVLFASQVLNMGTALISMLLITIGVLCIFTGIILNVLVKRIGGSS